MTDEMITFLDEQIALEKEIVDMSKKSVDKIKNVLIRELIFGITMDSKKHALLLNALKGALTEPTPMIEEEDFQAIKKAVEEHIALEAKAIETYQNILKQTSDKRVKTIIEEIARDEQRHHAFLKRLLKAIVEKETLTKDLLEDWLFKYAPFHGSPGG